MTTTAEIPFATLAEVVLELAEQDAEVLGRGQAGSHHLVLAAMAVEGTVIASALDFLGVEPDLVRRVVDESEQKSIGERGVAQAREWSRMLNRAQEIAQRDGLRFVTTRVLLLAALEDQESQAQQLIRGIGVESESISQYLHGSRDFEEIGGFLAVVPLRGQQIVSDGPDSPPRG